MPVISPDMHIGMTPVVSSLTTMDCDTTAQPGEYSGASLRFVATGASTSAHTITPPAVTQLGMAGTPVRVGGCVHFRLWCDDWTKISSLRFRFAPVGSNVGNCYIGTITDTAGKSTYGHMDTAYAAQWSNKWRTFVLPSNVFSMLASPALPWQANAKYFNLSTIQMDMTTTAACTLKIQRIYSPDWPVAFCATHLDLCYTGARNAITAAFGQRGWPWAFSVGSVNYAAQFPTTAELLVAQAAGADVHCHMSDTMVGDAATPFTAASTPERIMLIAGMQRRWMASVGLKGGPGMQWTTWLGNTGYGAGDTAGAAKRLGVLGGRGMCRDDTFGLNPTSSTLNTVPYTSRTHWVSDRGRYNRSHVGLHYPASGTATAADLDNWMSAKCKARLDLDYAALTSGGIHPWMHNVTTALTDGAPDIGPNLFAGFVQACQDYVSSGKLIMLTPAQVEALTYQRAGPYFVRWDGEWVHRDNPSQIAF